MATENLGKCVSYPAAADLSDYQYCFVVLDANGRIAIAPDASAAIGILQDDPDAIDRPGCVMIGAGISKIKTAGSTTKGGPVGVATGGYGVNAASGDHTMGVFLETGTGTDQINTMHFQPHGGTR